MARVAISNSYKLGLSSYDLVIETFLLKKGGEE